MNKNIAGNRIISIYLICVVLSVLITSCKSDKSEKQKHDESPESGIENKISSVCIWNGIAIREKPSRKSQALSTLNLGESFLYLNTFSIDSGYKNQKYLRIELSDGSVGWAADFGLVIDAKTGVVKSRVPVYKRPDLLTISSKEFSPMDIVAITEEKDSWYKVTGEKKRISGWIKMSHISMNEEDIALASIVRNKLSVNDDKTLLEKIRDILDKNPYPNSIFIETLNDIAREEEKKNSWKK
jgi:hypothetical protein